MTKFNKFVEVSDIDAAWTAWYEILTQDVCEEKPKKSRDGEVVGEVINATTVIDDPTRCLLKSDVRKLSYRYAIGEMLWYLSGNNSLDAIRLFTSNWDRMSDDGKTVNSNYGNIIQSKFGFNQFDYVYELLKNDRNTRQATIHIKVPRNTLENPTKDLNCTVYLQFFIREDKLYMISHMRSNDLWMGFPYDVFQFSNIQIMLAMKLGVGLGTYTHIADSLHLYKRDYDKSKKNMEV